MPFPDGRSSLTAGFAFRNAMARRVDSFTQTEPKPYIGEECV